jgi:biopolymer transport protein ExbD
MVDPNKKIKLTQLNMTPMIDCVFLLNLFFMVVTEITRQDQIEDVSLPTVKASKPDDNPDPQRLVINVLKDGKVYIGGSARSDRWLYDALAVEARISRTQAGISDRTVLVKADERTPFKYIRKLIALCVDKNIRIWRISFGTAPKQVAGAAEGK